MGNGLLSGFFDRRKIISADRFRSPVAGDQGNKIRPQPMGSPYGWGQFDDRKNMRAALSRIQTKCLGRYIDPSHLDVDLADQNPFPFIRDEQDSLSAVFNFSGITQLPEIQNIRLDFQPSLGSLNGIKRFAQRIKTSIQRSIEPKLQPRRHLRGLQEQEA